MFGRCSFPLCVRRPVATVRRSKSQRMCGVHSLQLLALSCACCQAQLVQATWDHPADDTSRGHVVQPSGGTP